MRDRVRLIFEIILLIAMIAACVVTFTGPELARSVALGAMMVLQAIRLVSYFVRRQRDKNAPPVPFPEVTTDQEAEIRDVRDQVSNVRAVKRLREMYPQLPLVDAVHYVRDLQSPAAA
jgi:hypothetical protein